jgi:hypothetical protein
LIINYKITTTHCSVMTMRRDGNDENLRRKIKENE